MHGRKIKIPGMSIELLINNQLGKGASGSVFQAQVSNNPSQKYALKVIPKHQTSERIVCQKLMEHDKQNECLNIAKIISVFELPEDEQYFFILMDFCNGRQLCDIMTKQRENLTDQILLDIICQISQGVAEIHSLKFVHRNLEPENILEHMDPFNGFRKITYKICDYGLLKQSNHVATKQIGTPLYMAPELLQGKDAYNEAVDIWSFGCIIFELLSSETYLQGQSVEAVKQDLLQTIQMNDDERKQHIFHRLPKNLMFIEQYYELITMMLSPDPHLRPKAEKVKQYMASMEVQYKQLMMNQFKVGNSQVPIKSLQKPQQLSQQPSTFQLPKNAPQTPKKFTIQQQFPPEQQKERKIIMQPSTDNPTNQIEQQKPVQESDRQTSSNHQMGQINLHPQPEQHIPEIKALSTNSIQSITEPPSVIQAPSFETQLQEMLDKYFRPEETQNIQTLGDFRAFIRQVKQRFCVQ